MLEMMFALGGMFFLGALAGDHRRLPEKDQRSGECEGPLLHAHTQEGRHCESAQRPA